MHTATNTELSIYFRLGGWRAYVVRAGSIAVPIVSRRFFPLFLKLEIA